MIITEEVTDPITQVMTATSARRMHFFYDAQSRPQMVQYTDETNATATYTYTHNLQGDITGMVDSQGDVVVSYSYDAWGKPTGTSTLTSEYD